MEKLQELSRPNSHYHEQRLIAQIDSLHDEVNELKAKIRELITQVQDSNNDFHPWEVEKLLEELLE